MVSLLEKALVEWDQGNLSDQEINDFLFEVFSRKRLKEVKKKQNEPVLEEKVSSCVQIRSRACSYCNKKFSSGRSLGGHIKVHTRMDKENQTKESSHQSSACTVSVYSRASEKVESSNINLLESLSGWKVHKSRGLKRRASEKSEDVIDIKSSGGEESTAQEEECEVDTYDDSNEDNSMTESLEDLGFSDARHKISKSRKRYVCHTCNILFPTFHSVGCHVHASATSPVNTEDDYCGSSVTVNKAGEGCEKRTSTGQVISTNVRPKMLDFDLNELPTIKQDEE